MLNTNKIETTMSSLGLTKAKLCSNVNIARTTLDAILNGGDVKLSTIEAIAKELHLTVGFLLDEETIEIRNAGRDYVERGNIEHKGAEYNSASPQSISALEDTIQQLKSQLKDKERIITLYERGVSMSE